MPRAIPPTENSITLRFGGGLNTRTMPDALEEIEAAAGQNFILDLERASLRGRPGFDLVGQVPNQQAIFGLVTLQKSDGSIFFAVQGGDKVYSWDGQTTFTEIATVDPAARLRGRMEHNAPVEDKVYVTDLNVTENVKQWDGTTFQDAPFKKNDAGDPFGGFKAKYCDIQNERSFFANVIDVPAASTLPHAVIGSKQGDTLQISFTRPSSSANEADPFFLVMPDLRPINGLVEAFGDMVFSTENGSLFTLQGQSAKDFFIDPFYPRSFASGEEAMAFIGNDIAYGRLGRIESVIATRKYGNVESDDITRKIANEITGLGDWTVAWNGRLNRTYFTANDSKNRLWVLQNALARQPSLTDVVSGEEEISPWSLWNTNHASSFDQTAIMNMLDPFDGLEYVFFGDTDGNLYRLEGRGNTGDAGTTAVETSWLSRTIRANLDAEMFNIEGWLRTRLAIETSVVLRFEFGGEQQYSEEVRLEFGSGVNETARGYYGSGSYYGANGANATYYGSATLGRISRERFSVPGHASEFQVRITFNSEAPVEIVELGLRFVEAS